MILRHIRLMEVASVASAMVDRGGVSRGWKHPGLCRKQRMLRANDLLFSMHGGEVSLKSQLRLLVKEQVPLPRLQAGHNILS